MNKNTKRLVSLLMAFMMLSVFLPALPFAKATTYTYNTVQTTAIANTFSITTAERNSFWANGRWWFFYDHYYQSSVNGISWTVATDLSTISSETVKGCYLENSTYFHIITDKHYRSGIPNSDGSITWKCAWTLAYSGSFSGLEYITMDSNGYVWIVRNYYYYGPYGEIVAMRNSWKNGSWTDGANFIADSSGSNGISYFAELEPVTNGHMLAVYGLSDAFGSSLYSSFFNGTAFEPHILLTTAHSPTHFPYIWQFSILGVEGVVYMVYIYGASYGGPPYEIEYSRFSASWDGSLSSWDVAGTLDSGLAESKGLQLSYNSISNTIMCFCTNQTDSNLLLYKNFYLNTHVWDSTWRVYLASSIDYMNGLVDGYTGSASIDYGQEIYSTYQSAQSFMAYNNATFTQVLLRLRGNSSVDINNFNVKIYHADSNGKPTGTAIGSTTMSVSHSNWDWTDNSHIATFASPISITSGMNYTIVVSAPSQTSSTPLRWGCDGSSPTFSDGFASNSTDSGSTWTTYLGCDLLFRIYMNQHFRNTAYSGVNFMAFRQDETGRFGVVFITKDVSYPTMFAANVIDRQPTIGEFIAKPTTAYAGSPLQINFTVQDLDGKEGIVNATIDITGDIVILYDSATGNFSKYMDTNSYCTLLSGSRYEINSTAYKLSVNILLSGLMPTGWKNIEAEYTKVYDIAGEYGSNDKVHLFYFSTGTPPPPPPTNGTGGMNGTLSFAPLDIYWNYTNFLRTYKINSFSGVFNYPIAYRITVWNSFATAHPNDPVVLENILLNLTKVRTGPMGQMDLGLRTSPTGPLLESWNIALFNISYGTVFLLNITLPKPIISPLVLLEMNSTDFSLGMMTGYDSYFPVYDLNGVNLGLSVPTYVQYTTFAQKYLLYPHSNFQPFSASPFYTTDTYMSLHYLDKPTNMFVILNVTGYLPFNVSSNYLVYSPDTTHHYMALPFNYFYNVGDNYFTVQGNTTFHVLPIDENSLQPISAEANIWYGRIYNNTYFVMYQLNNSSSLLQSITGYYNGVRRTSNTTQVTRLYFPYQTTVQAYTFSYNEKGVIYKVRDMLGNSIDMGLLSPTSQSFTVSLCYGKTYEVIIDKIHSFIIGADSNTVKVLYFIPTTSMGNGTVTFKAVRTPIIATVYFSDLTTGTLGLTPPSPSTLQIWERYAGSSYVLLGTYAVTNPMTISFTVNASRDYLAKVHYTSSHLFGTFDETIPFTYTGVTDLSTLLGVITLGDVTLSVANFVFTIILWGVFMLFSKDNAEIGIIIGIGLGFLFSWLGWLTFSASLLNLMYACILIAVLELMRRKEVGF